MELFMGILVLTMLQAGWADMKVSPIYIPVKENKINRLYIAMLDRDIEEAIKRTDPISGQSAIPIVSVTPENTYARMILTTENPTQWTADLAGALAYGYTIPTSKYYQQAMTLNRIRLILDAFDNLQDERGSLSHELALQEGTIGHAFLLEPLIQALALVANDLPEEERTRFSTTIDKGISFLAQHAIETPSAEGAIWCGVMALCHQYSGKKEHLDAAQQAYKRIRSMYLPSGEITDLQGLDYYRSLLSIQYLFLYRLMSGDGEADEALVRSLKWYTRLCAVNGLPLTGINYWPLSLVQTKMANVLGPLTYYADRNPEFVPIATRYLESLMDLPPGFSITHGGGYFLRGAQYHDRPDAIQPLPYNPYLEAYSQANRSIYLLVGKNYQTAVNLSGVTLFNGLQIWMYRGEKAIIAPAPQVRSRLVSFGFDSHRMNALSTDSTVSCHIESVTDGIDVVTVPDENVQTAYIFSNDMTVVVYRLLPGSSLVDWAQHVPVCAPVNNLTANTMTFDGTSARMLLPNVVPIIEAQGADIRIRARFNNDFYWFAFAGPRSKAVVKPVLTGVCLIHLDESGQIFNFALNLSDQPFRETMNFPGTDIPVPGLEAYQSQAIQTQ